MTRHLTRVVNVVFDAYDVYIGRPGSAPLEAPPPHLFGNPVVPGQRCPVCALVHRYPADTIPCFRTYLAVRLTNDRQFADAVLKLKGKALGCFCKPGPCHGDVYVELLEDSGTPDEDVLARMAERLENDDG